MNDLSSIIGLLLDTVNASFSKMKDKRATSDGESKEMPRPETVAASCEAPMRAERVHLQVNESGGHRHGVAEAVPVAV